VSKLGFPAGYRLEPLRREHPRRRFHSGQSKVDDWLATKALQNQEKHLSTTKVLLNEDGAIAGYYTLAPTQLEFSELPPDIARRLPHRLLPAAALAWLGVDSAHQGRGLGGHLLSQALRDCWGGSRIFPFVAVILDCVDDNAKAFYEKYGFAEMPGRPYRLFLSAHDLDAMMQQ
jgi:ribosomal protein S18 acetylase RimI-like enzyme